MRRLALLLVVGCAACGSDPEAPTPMQLPVAGAWSLSQLVQAGGTTCGEGGSLTITQPSLTQTLIAGTFGARGACETPSIAVDFVRSGDILNGAVDATRIRFSLGVCSYEGTLTGTPPSAAGGTARCTGLPGTTGELVGTWELQR
jgi:hypothetical protein